MDNRIPIPFPEGCKVVGAVDASSGGTRTTKFYIAGVHQELHPWGQIAFLRKEVGNDGVPKFETEVTVVQGFPSEMFHG
jgi:hypothetical protein